jgi:hypothetical protein
MRTTSVLVATAFTLVAGTSFAGPTDYVSTPLASAKFAPIDPKQPHGAQVAIVSGDPKTGPVSFFLKLPKGKVPMHWHTSNYWAVTVEGETKHWLPGKEAEAKAGGPGNAWYQAGGSDKQAHGDSCESEHCTVFIVMDKKLDLTPVK